MNNKFYYNMKIIQSSNVSNIFLKNSILQEEDDLKDERMKRKNEMIMMKRRRDDEFSTIQTLIVSVSLVHVHLLFNSVFNIKKSLISYRKSK